MPIKISISVNFFADDNHELISYELFCWFDNTLVCFSSGLLQCVKEATISIGKSKPYLLTYRLHYSLSLELVRQDKYGAGESKISTSANYSSHNRQFTGLNNGYSDYLLQLQATIGNQAVQGLVSPRNNERSARGFFESMKTNILQPKLKISQPGDAYEQQADRVADRVIRMPDVSDSHMSMKATSQEEEVYRKCTSCEMKYDYEKKEKEEDLSVGRKSSIVSDLETKDQVTGEINGVRSSSSSLSLDPSTKEFMELRLSHDFSNVRIYANESAAKSAQLVNAVAYTVGNNIIFGRGQYRPYTLEGKRLLAHELTHVLQQSAATSSMSHVQRTPKEKKKPQEKQKRQGKQESEEKPKRHDVIILGEGVEGGEELAAVLVRGGQPIQVTSVDDAVKKLKSINFPIGTLYFIAHSLPDGGLKFGKAEGFTKAADIANKLGGAIPTGNAPVKVDFRGCSIGTSPKAMDQIRAALGARSVIGGNCYLVIKYTTPILTADKKKISKASDVDTLMSHQKFVELKNKTLNKLHGKKCVLNLSEKGFFAAGGQFVSLWFNPKLSDTWDPKESVCYKDLTSLTVVDPDIASTQNPHCQLIKVQEKSEGKE